MFTDENVAHKPDYPYPELNSPDEPSWLHQATGSILTPEEMDKCSRFFEDRVESGPHMTFLYRGVGDLPMQADIAVESIPRSGMYFLAVRICNIWTNAHSYSFAWAADIAEGLVMVGEKTFEAAGRGKLKVSSEKSEIFTPVLSTRQAAAVDLVNVSASDWKIPLMYNIHGYNQSHIRPIISDDFQVHLNTSVRQPDTSILRKSEILAQAETAVYDRENTLLFHQWASDTIGIPTRQIPTSAPDSPADTRQPVRTMDEAVGEFFSHFYDIDPSADSLTRREILGILRDLLRNPDCISWAYRDNTRRTGHDLRSLVLHIPRIGLTLLVDMEQERHRGQLQSGVSHIAWLLDSRIKKTGWIGEVNFKFQNKRNSHGSYIPEMQEPTGLTFAALLKDHWRLSYLLSLAYTPGKSEKAALLPRQYAPLPGSQIPFNFVESLRTSYIEPDAIHKLGNFVQEYLGARVYGK